MTFFSDTVKFCGEQQAEDGKQRVAGRGRQAASGSAPVREANGCDKKKQMHMERVDCGQWQ